MARGRSLLLDPRLLLAVAAALAAVLAPAGASGGSGPSSLRGEPVKAALAKLRTASAASMAGYSRARFGPAWEDVDHNHCDTRNDILRRDLTRIVFRAGSRCIVATGTLHDPYTGKTIRFVRGVRTSFAVQIDHVVALADAWRTGAARWTPARRLAYANDPLVLLAVDGPSNEAKGDDDASAWVPPNRAFDCPYVARQVAIKTRYRLWVTRAERAAMTRVLSACQA